jgi:integrase
MTIRLTETAIARALKDAARSGVRPGDLIDAGQRGLRLRVTPKGIAAWVLACRDKGGKMRRFPLGSWPEMGIAKAREAARALHHRVRVEGADPIDERRKARAKDTSGTSTLAGIIDIYEQQKGATLRSWPEYRKSIGRVFGPLIGRSLADLSVVDLQLAADHYAARAQAALAVRCLRPILKWASAPGRAYVPSALAAISLATGVKRRERVLSRDELAALLPVLRADKRPYAAAMRFMLLTLSRREEVCRARWRDIDWKAGTWTIPATNSKNKQPHVLPLSRQALELLQQGPQGEPSALIFHTRSGGKLGNWDRETKIIQKKSHIGEWHRHDLRRTGSTLLGEMGELTHVLEAALNHASIHSPLAATYNRSRYRPQVAAALARLADALDEIEAGLAPTQAPAD